MGISVAASLHLAASVPNLIGHGHALMSHLRLKEDILVEGSFHYDGKDMIVPQDCAGLGVKIDEEKLERRTLERFVLEIEK
jgi:L-alanine-DL-glutamate epimerase-like enolase superfamily enzyme